MSVNEISTHFLKIRVPSIQNVLWEDTCPPVQVICVVLQHIIHVDRERNNRATKRVQKQMKENNTMNWTTELMDKQLQLRQIREAHTAEKHGIRDVQETAKRIQRFESRWRKKALCNFHGRVLNTNQIAVHHALFGRRKAGK